MTVVSAITAGFYMHVHWKLNARWNNTAGVLPTSAVLRRHEMMLPPTGFLRLDELRTSNLTQEEHLLYRL